MHESLLSWVSTDSHPVDEVVEADDEAAAAAGEAAAADDDEA